MIRYENTVPGIFVRRVNRFVAEVLIDGKTERVHVKNTGRLGELLVPKAAVTLQRASDPKRKTAYDLISVYEPELKQERQMTPGMTQVLKVTGLKHGPSARENVGLYVDIGTDGFFRNLCITCED